MIRRLIAFDTTSRNSNLELIAYIREYLAGLGVESHLVFDDERRKANLYATMGPADRPGIALSGHTDVVPVDGQDWSSDPWKVAERDGRLYGRGTCDMKGFIGIALALAPEFLRRRLQTPIHLVFSYDEEVGCVGVRGMIEHLRRLPVRPTACIIGEPTDMKIVTGHKGKTSLRCHVHGHECHSSLTPRGVNAVEMAAEIIAYLRGMGRRFAAEGPFDPDFDVPHATAHTGIVQGGTALNIVPKDCRFEFEFRYLPGMDPETLVAEVRRFAEERLLPEMRRVQPASGFYWEPISAFPGLATPAESDVVGLARSLTGANAVTKVAFGTEAGLFQEAGIPTIVCGPGSIDQAHKPDEYVELSQVALCEGFLRRLMDRVCVAG